MSTIVTCKRCDASGRASRTQGRTLKPPPDWWTLARQRPLERSAITVGFYCSTACIILDVRGRVVDIEADARNFFEVDPTDNPRDPHVCHYCRHEAKAADTAIPGGWYYLYEYVEGHNGGGKRIGRGLLCSATCVAAIVEENHHGK